MEVTNETLFLIALVVVLHIVVVIVLIKKPKKSVKGRHVVVTGGSSGIGLWAAVHCVKRGAHVTVVARNITLLEKAKRLLIEHRVDPNQRIECKSLDLSESYETVVKVFSEIERASGPIYMLVNCAGMAICGTVEDVPVADAEMMMNINYYGTYYPTRFVLPKMREAGEGIIVITASQAALFGIYGYGPYSASKFALRGLAETISVEYGHKGISVTLALPVDTDTPGLEREEKTKPRETKIISGTGGLAKPEDVARQMVDDALVGTFFSVYGFESYIVTVLCSGMTRWGGIAENLVQAALMGPLRLFGQVVQWHFRRIVHKCEKETKSEKEKTN